MSRGQIVPSFLFFRFFYFENQYSGKRPPAPEVLPPRRGASWVAPIACKPSSDRSDLGDLVLILKIQKVNFGKKSVGIHS